jgi:hypothetical protein
MSLVIKEIMEVFLVGVGLASCWFYIRTLLTGDLTNRSIYRWGVSIVPMGIAIAWGLRIMGVL